MKPLLTALFLGAATLPAAAFDIEAMNEVERAAFGEAVKSYLMDNPEVLVESINVLEQRRAENEGQNDRALVEAYADDIFNDGHSWVGGNLEGDLTLVEFVDYRCSVCRQLFPELEKTIRDDGNIRVILKEFPILGQDSDTASRFAVSVLQTSGADAYKATHDALMELKGPVNLASLKALAEKLDLDAPAILDHMNSEDVSDVLRQNRQLAEKMQVRGTPTLVIGDELLRGVPRAGLQPVIDAIRARQ